MIQDKDRTVIPQMQSKLDQITSDRDRTNETLKTKIKEIE